MQVNKYLVRVKHDHGVVNIHTTATTEDAARHIVIEAERCPERAILSVQCLGVVKPKDDWTPIYSPWRHGGWYVHNVRYPSGAIGCVSRNYPDGKWRIVCDDRRTELDAPGDYTFPTRDAAARAEFELAKGTQPAPKGWSAIEADD